jgi:ribose 5-phosphate isomerase B
MRVVVGADHAGYELKETLKAYIAGLGHEVVDMGASSLQPSDYPDYARAVGEAIMQGRGERGVLICGSGVGACVTANKIPGLRAAVCHDGYSAHQGVEHDDMNVLCLGARVIGEELAKELVRIFLEARFSGEERHKRRLGKILATEAEYLKHER